MRVEGEDAAAGKEGLAALRAGRQLVATCSASRVDNDRRAKAVGRFCREHYAEVDALRMKLRDVIDAASKAHLLDTFSVRSEQRPASSSPSGGGGVHTREALTFDPERAQHMLEMAMSSAQRIRFNSTGPPLGLEDPRHRAYYGFPFPVDQQFNASRLKALVAERRARSNEMLAQKAKEADESQQQQQQQTLAMAAGGAGLDRGGASVGDVYYDTVVPASAAGLRVDAGKQPFEVSGNSRIPMSLLKGMTNDFQTKRKRDEEAELETHAGGQDERERKRVATERPRVVAKDGGEQQQQQQQQQRQQMRRAPAPNLLLDLNPELDDLNNDDVIEYGGDYIDEDSSDEDY